MPVITVISDNKTIKINASRGSLLSDVLAHSGFAVTASCGGRGICKKCSVKLLSGSFDAESPDENSLVRSCRAVITGDAVIECGFSYGEAFADIPVSEAKLQGAGGVAVDIGTTTLAAAFVKPDGSTEYASALNPQSTYGADVVNRITACTNGQLETLRDCVRAAVNSLINKLTGGTTAPEAVIAGNTVMLHIFCGISPESMGVFPFTPQFTEAKYFEGKELGLNAERVTVLPSVSAYIGADVLAGAYALGLHKTEKRALLVDLGTNGETVLSDKGKLRCTSSAAGPALEGACIECGSGGVSGAVSAVFEENGRIAVKTVNNAPGTSICGAGLADAAALMLRKGIIDETGYLEDERFYITDNIYISQGDIRQLQLAKSAVCAAVQTLLYKSSFTENGIDEIYIAGGLGYYLNCTSAFEIGLLPRFDPERVKSAGNTSLKGALMCIGSPSAVSEMQALSDKCTVEELGGDAFFNEKFIQNMYFC